MNNIFEISKSGLTAAQKALTVTSNNIANANTDGYSRQRAELVPAQVNQAGKSIPVGVSVSEVRRIRDILADRQIFTQSNALNASLEQSRIYRQLESVLITDFGESLDSNIGNFFNAFSELSTAPQDISLRNNVLTQAEVLTSQLRTLDKDITDIQDQVSLSAGTYIDRANDLLQGISEINGAIFRSFALGDQSNIIKDRQVEMLNELSELMDTQVSFTEAGTAEIRVGGVMVLNQDYVAQLAAETSLTDNVFRVRNETGKQISLTGGRLGGAITMFTEGIPSVADQLDEITEYLVTEVNQIHSSGFGVVDGNQRAFFSTTGLTAGEIEVHTLIKENVGHIAASSVAGESGNNDKAIELNFLRDVKGLRGESVTDRAIKTISEPGIRINELDVSIEVNESALNLLRTQQEEVSGVNIDEELSNLIKFQNAYQASARVLNTAQELLTTLLSIA